MRERDDKEVRDLGLVDGSVFLACQYIERMRREHREILRDRGVDQG